ncbi:MAG: DUF2461 domain-containing protein [Bryobacteraceae bacterium]
MPGSRNSSKRAQLKTQEANARGEFTGLPVAGFQLLQQLKKNNNREWFRERKSIYREAVEQPMEALVSAVSDACRARGVPLFAKEKNPVMRVYRDIRFSADKTPFKTHVAAELRRSFGGSQTMLYLHFAPDKSFVAAGVWQPDRALLQAWRAAIVSNPEEIEKIAAALKRKKLALELEHSLSSMPRGLGHLAELSFARFLKLTSFVLSRTIDPDDWHSPKLVSKVVTFACDAKPLLEFGWKVEETLPKSFPE